jgi:hypothetical protein
MGNKSRDLRATVVRALAKVGLVWAVAVLGALFMAMASQGQHQEDQSALSSARSGAHHAIAVSSGDAPRSVGLGLTLMVLAGGATVLVAGACRGGRTVEPSTADDTEPAMELPVTLDLGLLAA